MNEQQILVKFTEDYADEFDISGFRVMTETKWNSHIADVRLTAKWPQSKYFGSNEGIEWASFDDYLRAFKVVPITPEQAEFLDSAFSVSDRGNFLQLDEYYQPNPLY